MASNAGYQGPPRYIYLAAGPRTSAEARWFLREALEDRQPPEQVQLAALLATEIISFTARHRRDESEKRIRVTTGFDGSRLQVAVRDRGSRFALGAATDVREDIWGLMLVERLSSRWGMERSAAGTHVWFEL
jgi:anti-sigma regulatory factor (Ser/Thr protein kinase)